MAAARHLDGRRSLARAEQESLVAMGPDGQKPAALLSL
jgi:hypothetical protein